MLSIGTKKVSRQTLVAGFGMQPGVANATWSGPKAH